MASCGHALCMLITYFMIIHVNITFSIFLRRSCFGCRQRIHTFSFVKYTVLGFFVNAVNRRDTLVCLLLSHPTIKIGTRPALRSLFVLHVLHVDVPWGGVIICFTCLRLEKYIPLLKRIPNTQCPPVFSSRQLPPAVVMVVTSFPS